MSYSQHSKGVIALVVLAFGFGAIAIAVRFLGASFTLFQQLYLTIGLAFVFSLVFFGNSLTLTKIQKVPTKDWYLLLFRVVIGYLIGASLYRESLNLTKISNVAFIQSIPFVAIFGWILLKEKFTFRKFLLILVAFAGVFLISIKDYFSIVTLGKGEVFSFISSALFALSYISRRWQSDFLNDKEITQILLLLGTVLLFLTSVAKGEGVPIIQWNTEIILAILFTGFFNVVNIYLINFGFKNVKAVLASNILTLEAIFALVLAFVFFRELPTALELVGGILIIGSVVQMNRLEDK